MFRRFDKSNKSKSKILVIIIQPISQVLFGIWVGTSIIAFFQPPGWIIWSSIVLIELFNIYYYQKSINQLKFIFQFKKGLIFGFILDAFRLGS